MWKRFARLLAVVAAMFAVCSMGADGAVATPAPTTNTTTATSVPTTTTASPPTEVPVTEVTIVTGKPPSPTEAESPVYRLLLSGTRQEWRTLLDRGVDKVQRALVEDLARKFYTDEGNILIQRLSVGSLEVEFSVARAMDGTQINEGAFLAQSKTDNSWLASTAKLYSDVSSSRLEATSTGFVNSTQPPKHIVCSDGCAGGVAAGAVVVAVVAAFGLWAWRAHSKEADAKARKELGIVDDSEPTARDAAPVISTPAHGFSRPQTQIFSNPRSGANTPR